MCLCHFFIFIRYGNWRNTFSYIILLGYFEDIISYHILNFQFPLIFCSRAIWHNPHAGMQAITNQSSHTEPPMLYLLRMLVRKAIRAPGRQARQQLSSLSWATLQARMQGTNVPQRQMPQSSQQSHAFVFHSDDPEDTVYCVTVTWGCAFITFVWNSMAWFVGKFAVHFNSWT